MPPVTPEAVLRADAAIGMRAEPCQDVQPAARAGFCGAVVPANHVPEARASRQGGRVALRSAIFARTGPTRHAMRHDN